MLTLGLEMLKLMRNRVLVRRRAIWRKTDVDVCLNRVEVGIASVVMMMRRKIVMVWTRVRLLREGRDVAVLVQVENKDARTLKTWMTLRLRCSSHFALSGGVQ